MVTISLRHYDWFCDDYSIIIVSLFLSPPNPTELAKFIALTQQSPFHIHDIQFLILDRDGAPPSAGESGWKDTVFVDAGETVRVITEFSTYADPEIPYMYHCHILEHEDGGMMGQFIVVE